TRPGAAAVDAETEKRRALPVIESLAKAGAAVSADTMKAEVMRCALDAGACILNDVRGFCAPKSRAVAVASDCGVVIMHMKGAPQTMQNAPHYDDVIGEVGDFLRRRTREMIDAGIAPARICVDPGIGFGKTPEHNLQLMRNLPRLGGDRPLLLGASRKSWLRAVCGEMDLQLRDSSGAAAAAILSRRGAAVLRVHNVAATRAALQIAAALAE
ncbi:MAG: dihydropteroate synthase, partial [Gammaproteobacteria bacterium]